MHLNVKRIRVVYILKSHIGPRLPSISRVQSVDHGSAFVQILANQKITGTLQSPTTRNILEQHTISTPNKSSKQRKHLIRRKPHTLLAYILASPPTLQFPPPGTESGRIVIEARQHFWQGAPRIIAWHPTLRTFQTKRSNLNPVEAPPRCLFYPQMCMQSLHSYSMRCSPPTTVCDLKQRSI